MAEQASTAVVEEPSVQLSAAEAGASQGASAKASAAGAAAEQPAAAPSGFDPNAYTNDPAFRSWLNKEQAAERARWDQQQRERIRQEAEQAERERAYQDRFERARKAREGDMDAQQQLAEDVYATFAQEQAARQERLRVANEYDATVQAVAKELGDSALLTKLDWRNFKTIPEWHAAMADARADKLAGERAEALAASRLAELRNKLPNPDTKEMVGGSGGPLSYKSQTDLEAQYVKAKSAGDPDEVRRIRNLMHSPDFRRLPRSA